MRMKRGAYLQQPAIVPRGREQSTGDRFTDGDSNAELLQIVDRNHVRLSQMYGP